MNTNNKTNTHTAARGDCPAAATEDTEKAELMADLRKAFAAEDRAERMAPTPEKLTEAIDRLRRSERGSACLRRFLSLMNDYGFGLDVANWQALATLCRAGAAGQQHRILAIVEARRRGAAIQYPEGEE